MFNSADLKIYHHLRNKMVAILAKSVTYFFDYKFKYWLRHFCINLFSFVKLLKMLARKVNVRVMALKLTKRKKNHHLFKLKFNQPQSNNEIDKEMTKEL